MDDLIKSEKARSSAYRGIAECYYMPGVGTHKTLAGLKRQFEILDSEASPQVALMVNEMIAEESEIDDLCVDYARLFVGPYALLAPPYGSVYLDGERQVMGNSTLDVRKRYGDAGLALSPHFKEPPDHIAAELEFMHFLVFNEIEAALQGDRDRSTNYVDQQGLFLYHHLAAWVPQFVHQVLKHAESGFYKNLAMATDLFIKDEYDRFFSCQSGADVGAAEESTEGTFNKAPASDGAARAS